MGVYAVYSLGIRHKRPLIAKPSSLSSAPSQSTSNPTSPSSATTKSSAQTQTASGASSSSGSTSSGTSSSSGKYKDGTYKGSVVNAYYGNVQVSVTISGGRISDVKFLQYPNTHSTSVYINSQAMPYLKQEAIQAQSSNVQTISGATFTSYGFIQSLQSALSKA